MLLRGLFLAAVLFVVLPASAVTYSTSFPLTENPVSEGGKWVNGKADGVSWNNIATANGFAIGTHKMLTAPPYDDCIAHISKSFMTFGNDQFAQGTVHRVSGYQWGHEIELLLRFQITANNARGYEIYWSTNGGLYIVRWNGPLNDFTSLYTVSPGLANEGDVVRAEAVGSTITVKINGNVVLTGSNGTWTSGQPGIGLNPYDPNSDMSSYGWSDFTAGDMGTAAESRAPERAPLPGIVSGDGSVKVFGISGRLVAHGHAPEFRFDTRGVPVGLYLVMESGKRVRAIAVVK
jgi:hypothetical protein